jgi:hypothetical protein
MKGVKPIPPIGSNRRAVWSPTKQRGDDHWIHLVCGEDEKWSFPRHRLIHSRAVANLLVLNLGIKSATLHIDGSTQETAALLLKLTGDQNCDYTFSLIDRWSDHISGEFIKVAKMELSTAPEYELA